MLPHGADAARALALGELRWHASTQEGGMRRTVNCRVARFLKGEMTFAEGRLEYADT